MDDNNLDYEEHVHIDFNNGELINVDYIQDTITVNIMDETLLENSTDLKNINFQIILVFCFQLILLLSLSYIMIMLN